MSRSRPSRGSPSRGSNRCVAGQTPLPCARAGAGLRCTTISRVTRPAVGGSALAHEHRLPRAGGGRGDLGEPEIGRPAVPLARFGGDISVRARSATARRRAASRRRRRRARARPSTARSARRARRARLRPGNWRLELEPRVLALAFAWRLGGKGRGGGTQSAQAISNDAIAAAANWRAGITGTPRAISPRRTQEYPEMLGAIMANCTPSNGRDAAMIGQVRRVGVSFGA